MENETTRDFLDRRERELTQQVSALQGQVSALQGQIEDRKAEIEDIQRARAALGPRVHEIAASFHGSGALNADVVVRSIADRQQQQVAAMASGITEPVLPRHYDMMTIKELAVQALLDHFRKGGTAAEIRDFIKNAYGRTIEPSSLRPQLHRLKSDNVLVHDPAFDNWNLTVEKRRLYLQYNHPSSRKGMKELRDETDNSGGQKDA
jgi:hypothetical protein